MVAVYKAHDGTYMFFAELGTVQISELESLHDKAGFPLIERDKHYRTCNQGS